MVDARELVITMPSAVAVFDSATALSQSQCNVEYIVVAQSLKDQQWYILFEALRMFISIQKPQYLARAHLSMVTIIDDQFQRGISRGEEMRLHSSSPG